MGLDLPCILMQPSCSEGKKEREQGKRYMGSRAEMEGWARHATLRGLGLMRAAGLWLRRISHCMSWE